MIRNNGEAFLARIAAPKHVQPIDIDRFSAYVRNFSFLLAFNRIVASSSASCLVNIVLLILTTPFFVKYGIIVKKILQKYKCLRKYKRICKSDGICCKMGNDTICDIPFFSNKRKYKTKY